MPVSTLLYSMYIITLYSLSLSPSLPPSLSLSLSLSVCGLSLRMVIQRFYYHTPPTSTAVSGSGVEPVMGVVLSSRVVTMVPSDAGDIIRFENEILRIKNIENEILRMKY